MQHTEKPFLSIAELGKRLGVSERTAYNYVRAGEVPAIRLNGVSRVPLGAFEQWLADKQREALAAVRGEKSP
jgi:excisionase family DNA binding protein